MSHGENIYKAKSSVSYNTVRSSKGNEQLSDIYIHITMYVVSGKRKNEVNQNIHVHIVSTDINI